MTLASMAEREESQTKFKSEELPCGTWEKLKEMSKNENNKPCGMKVHLTHNSSLFTLHSSLYY